MDIERILAPLGSRSTFVTIESRNIDVDLLKSGNPYYCKATKSWSIYKKTTCNGVINWHYEACVNRQREREGMDGDFEAYPRQWGVRLHGTPFVEHTNKAGDTFRYLEMKVQKVLSVSYHYIVGDREINKNDLREWFPAAKISRQGVDKEVICRDFRLDSIIGFHFSGEVYREAA